MQGWGGAESPLQGPLTEAEGRAWATGRLSEAPTEDRLLCLGTQGRVLSLFEHWPPGSPGWPELRPLLQGRTGG